MGTYIRVVLDLLNGNLVELTSVAIPVVLASEFAVNALVSTIRQRALSNVALVNALNPGDMGVEIEVLSTRLQPDDVAVLDNGRTSSVRRVRGGLGEA